MGYGKMVIIDNNTNDRLCIDRKWRSEATFDVDTHSVQTWKLFSYACRRMDIIDAREPEREPVIVHLHPDDEMDENGMIHRGEGSKSKSQWQKKGA